jgi:ectoine hydroxylase-related dioxygenase (phytanoyl-CoA dioxygenase family)
LSPGKDFKIINKPILKKQKHMFTDIKNLPALDEFKSISKEEIKEFRENGHVLIRNILSPDEIAVYREVIVDAGDTFNKEKRKLEDRDIFGKAFLQIMNLWRDDARVKKFVMAKRFARIAADLLGVDNVRIYHDQALFKEPGGGPTPWHQDQFYWPVSTRNTITMWMPLVDVQKEMGILTFASGSHKEGNVFDFEISESEPDYEQYVRENNFALDTRPFMNAGDATWHYGHTAHNAPGNNSTRRREIMTIIYFADGAKVAQPTNKWQVNDHQQWLMSLPVGELAASELNPLML